MSRRVSFSAGCAAALLVPAIAYAHPLSLVRDLPALREYLALGFTHILSGFDHLLFLAGLVLVRGRTRDLLLAVTAFTLAHSLSLAMTVLDVLRPNPSWIEPLIALSIAYVGAENLWRPNPAGRFRIAFAFGLIHGCGFAAALREIGLPQGRMAAALVLFNLGVELGQLLVLACVLPLLSRALRLAFMQRNAAGALNLALVAIGLFWAGARVFAASPAVARDVKPSAKPELVALARAVPVPHSTYPALGSAATPQVSALCKAFAELPRSRRAECSGHSASVALTGECERMLSAAIDDGSIAIESEASRACVAATEARYVDCSFASAPSLPALPVCTALWHGHLKAGASCRSSLECTDGLYCRGMSPLDRGRCAEPSPRGTPCDLALDPLASYLPHDPSAHRECANACRKNRCE